MVLQNVIPDRRYVSSIQSQMSRMAMEWKNKKLIRSLWASLVISTFALSVLFVFVILNLGSYYSSMPQGSLENIPHSEKLTEEECIPVCGSVGCIQQSKMFLDHLQPASNPCDNFNKFACGRFAGRFPDGGGSWVKRLNKRRRIRSRNILENLAPSPNSASDKMKIVYDSCMKPDSETEAVSTLLQILETFGIEDWPNLTSDFKFENSTRAKVIANLLLHEEYGFVALSREMNEIPSFLKVTRGSQTDPRLALVDVENLSNNVRKHQIDRILKYFNLKTETVTKIQEETEEMDREIENLKMESENIAADSMLNDSHVDCSRDTENEWTDLCEVINLFLDIAEVSEEVSSSNVSIESGEIHYMRSIFPLLRNFSDGAVANYLAIGVILNHLNDLNIYFHLTSQKGASDALKLFDMVRPIDRWQSCVDWIASSMSYALLYEYGKKEFTITMFHQIANLTDELLHEVADYYSQQEWVPEDIRKIRPDEIRNYKLQSPSTKYFPSETTVNDFYDGFKPKDGIFLSYVMEFRKFKTVEKMRNDKFRGIHEREIFIAEAFGGGGFIEIGLTLLQPPYFSTGVQKIFNLVSLGFFIVHEIGHSMFYYRDARESDVLMRNMQCIIDQVSQYKFELIGQNLNGEQYLWEDLADNAATSITDKIIERYLSEGLESFLPGLPFPTKQLLYIKSALLFCSAKSKRKEELYSKGTHSPDDVRIYQRMRNSKIFSQAFDCPVGSFMNPADKCLVLTDGTAT